MYSANTAHISTVVVPLMNDLSQLNVCSSSGDMLHNVRECRDSCTKRQLFDIQGGLDIE